MAVITSDHQRSLSIDKASGWGHCFNAACDATVLVADWNPALAKQLIRTHYQGLTARASTYPTTRHESRHVAPTVVQHAPRVASTWQQDELAALLSMQEHLRTGLLHSARAQAYLEQRKIPLELAVATGVGYFPTTMLDSSACSLLALTQCNRGLTWNTMGGNGLLDVGSYLTGSGDIEWNADAAVMVHRNLQEPTGVCS